MIDSPQPVVDTAPTVLSAYAPDPDARYCMGKIAEREIEKMSKLNHWNVGKTSSSFRWIEMLIQLTQHSAKQVAKI